MRLSSLALRFAVFAIAALVCLFAARMAVAVVEGNSASAVEEVLRAEGFDWAEIQSDGLQVVIEGEAPNEVTRFRAISAAGSAVDASRVIDNMRVAENAIDTTPAFSIEILRNESGVSLIGLIPLATDREAINRRVSGIADGAKVADLLDQADYPVPATWQAALDYGMRALAMLPRSKISVAAEKVVVTAIAVSEREKMTWQDELVRIAPEGVAVETYITAPRPVMAPFTVSFTKTPDGARFESCAADTTEGLTQIIAAAEAAGMTGEPDCILALGVPSVTWGDAVSMAIAAVDDLGGGQVTFADADVSLVAREGTDQALFDEVIGRLQNDLPDVFSLEARLPVKPEATPEGPPKFTATLSPEGLVQLRGKVTDELLNTTAENYARARFGQGQVDMRTRIVETAQDLPQDWSIRVLTGIEALSEMARGSVVVEPDSIVLQGVTGNKKARSEISSMIVEKLGEDAAFSLDTTYDEAFDPLAALPTPQECVAKINAVSKRVKINFEPGSAKIVAEARGAMDEIADILRKCMELPLQISGYTDSQGRDEMNQRLSQQRADAVLDALRTRRVPTGSFEAIGFGEENPIASNDTPEGREANRRIEFTLRGPVPGEAEPAADSGTEPAADSDAEAGTEPAAAPGAEAAAEASSTDTPAGAEPADPTAAPVSVENTGGSVVEMLDPEEAAELPRPPVRNR